MFSGIISWQAPILAIDHGTFTMYDIFGDLTLGQSIAHDGACMTISALGQESYSFFVMEESFAKTNFASKKVWQSFNVERSIKYGDPVDGHFVSGHIDTTASVKMIEKKEDGSRYVTITLPSSSRPYLIDKGSIAINGVSLTVIDPKLDTDRCLVAVSLIPYTMAHTNLGTLQIGDLVNIELDMLGKYVVGKQ